MMRQLRMACCAACCLAQVLHGHKGRQLARCCFGDTRGGLLALIAVAVPITWLQFLCTTCARFKTCRGLQAVNIR